MKRYSKKRQAILDFLENTKEHPSAEKIYQQLKPSYPDLSMGTVYRNLNEMKECGSIVSVAVVEDKERFDARTDPHTHVICSGCGKVIDLDEITLPSDLLSHVEKASKFSISHVNLQFVGLCDECAKTCENVVVSE